MVQTAFANKFGATPKKNAISLGQVLPKLLEKIGLTAKNYALAAIVENEISKSCPEARIVGFRNNILYIEVESSAELQELAFRKREISKAVANAFPIDSIRSAPEFKFFIKGMARLGAKENNRSNNSLNWVKPQQKFEKKFNSAERKETYAETR